MKQLISTTICKVLLISSVFAQSTFERTYPYGIGTAVCPLNNGEFVTAVNYPLYGIARMDANGNVISFSNVQNSTVNNLRPTNDGGLVYTGMNINDGTASVTKVDINGNNIWTKSFQADGFSANASGILPQTDDTYLFNMSSNGGTTSSPYEVFKLDNYGNELWRNYPGDGYASSHSLMNSNNVIIDAYTTSVGDEFGIITLAGIDNTTGVTQWTRTFYDPSLMIDYTYPGYSLAAGSACLSSTNNIYLAGSKSYMTEPFVGTPYQFLMKTDDEGALIWSKTFSEGTFSQISETHDGCFVVIGSAAANTGIQMMKLDANGDSLWSKTFTAFSSSRGLDFHETSDNGFIISGYAYEDAMHQYYTYLIKTDSQGNVGNISTMITSHKSIFRNATFGPTLLHDRSTVNIPAESLSSETTGTIIDMTGKVIRQFTITSESTIVERETLASGSYSLMITNKSGANVNFKFVVE